MTEKKDELINQMKKQYDDLNYQWSRKRDKFEANMQHESADAKKEYEEAREDFRKFRKEMKEKIIDLEEAGDKAGKDLIDGAENAWNIMAKAFDKASSHFKK
jgi:ElaB/YqjD/DUF883 family membrane-anchored ribosome-binding protein